MCYIDVNKKFALFLDLIFNYLFHWIIFTFRLWLLQYLQSLYNFLLFYINKTLKSTLLYVRSYMLLYLPKNLIFLYFNSNFSASSFFLSYFLSPFDSFFLATFISSGSPSFDSSLSKSLIFFLLDGFLCLSLNWFVYLWNFPILRVFLGSTRTFGAFISTYSLLPLSSP